MIKSFLIKVTLNFILTQFYIDYFTFTNCFCIQVEAYG